MLATCLFCGERTQQTDAWCTLTKAFACNGNVKKAEDDQNVKEAKKRSEQSHYSSREPLSGSKGIPYE